MCGLSTVVTPAGASLTMYREIRSYANSIWDDNNNNNIMVTTRYSDQQGSKSRQKVMRLYKQWHRPISKRFIKPPYSILRATSIDSECCRLPTTNVLSKKPERLRKNYAPTSFDQQVQDSQGHTLYRNKNK